MLCDWKGEILPLIKDLPCPPMLNMLNMYKLAVAKHKSSFLNTRIAVNEKVLIDYGVAIMQQSLEKYE